MAKTYSQIVSRINDELNDNNFSSNRASEYLAAINAALDTINIGDIGEDRGADLEVGYEFQREETSITFDADSPSNALSAGLNLKFPERLIITTDENIRFEYVDPKYYSYKKGVFGSLEHMFTIEEVSGVKTLKTRYSTSDILTLYFFSFNMVLNGSTRQQYFTGDDNETLLMPDRFWDTVVKLAAARLARQRYEDRSTMPDVFKGEGIAALKMMINSIGTIQKKPAKRAKIRSEWPSVLSRIQNN